MERESVQALYDLARAIVASDDRELVRVLLERYEGGEMTFRELLDEVRTLHGRIQ